MRYLFLILLALPFATYGATLVTIAGQTYTQAQYTSLKTQYTFKMDNRSLVPISYKDALIWLQIANREIGICKKMTIDTSKGANVIDLINQKIKLGQC